MSKSLNKSNQIKAKKSSILQNRLVFLFANPQKASLFTLLTADMEMERKALKFSWNCYFSHPSTQRAITHNLMTMKKGSNTCFNATKNLTGLDVN